MPEPTALAPSTLAGPVGAAAPGAAAGDNEFVMTRGDFDLVRRLIHRHAGIHLADGKEAMVYGRLARRLRETGQASFTNYLQQFERTVAAGGPAAEAEVQQFINCLTTNLTSFFREEHHFPALAEDLRARAALGAQPLRVWCSAASTGEEPYSIALTALEALGASARVEILATDIDTQVLATAERGVYAADARGLTEQRLRAGFQRGTGPNSGRIRVRPELARLVRFSAFNLVTGDWSRLGQPFDVIFCRNVMIYFDAPTQRRVLKHMHGVLKPGGLLYVGHSENFSDARELFRLRGKTVYERA
ncbi:MAG: methyltransferase domain-containing protein [Betaproteobacteria bacterium]|nr:methyltransferase domain-containing protein [Betaproteobacteria bacterium]MCC6850915.1 methyltransferase domain-containing protein [Rubrivivax sp.]MCL4699116.1 methyltransferase domain-containing protein [Burkholderiaceae bacterium]